ncbi:hypothetical protein MHZ92_20030 [Sporosarcina sp. ACRSL]|uniref:hypothetical protein n=1 Tax=Sporosarcina sp. ACRSL TaxID=2918215 RepID=UPI001EF655E9|nr:hypothetical protein [Sporosarcina sp. ACRSL]MCG7346398.1 hypothetical protein [Sporosarcina sp. ACRSL]
MEIAHGGMIDLKGKCFHCGNDTRQGGIWQGIGYDVAVCPDEDCMRALLHTVYDAMKDTMPLDEDKRHVSRWFMELTAEVSTEKGRI